MGRGRGWRRRRLPRSVWESQTMNILRGGAVWTHPAHPEAPAGTGLAAGRGAEPPQIIGRPSMVEPLLERAGSAQGSGSK